MIFWPTYSREQRAQLSALAERAGLEKMTEAEYLRLKAEILSQNNPPTRTIIDPIWRTR